MGPLFTVGHSTRTIADFAGVLRTGEVDLVVDVRTVPRSRTNPQYNEDVLPANLEPFEVAYRRIAGLGGLRGRSASVPPEVNGWWKNLSFHNYADYALSDAFAEALAQLLDLSNETRTAIMCSEALWWRCHRRIVADYALSRGLQVFHLMGPGKIEQAAITPAAKAEGDKLIYPA